MDSSHSFKEIQTKELAEHYKAILSLLHEDPLREGLQKTPQRVAQMMQFLTNGYEESPSEILSSALFSEACEGMVIVRDIDFYSLCEHHLLPFFGKVSVGYLPNGQIVGLSKIARVVEVFSRRLQIQERMTQEIAQTIQEVLHPHGVIVRIEARHTCMEMRGVEKTNALTTTLSHTGVFNEPTLREEFFSLLRK